MAKFGPIKFMAPCMLVLGAATIGIGCSEQMNSYMFYAVCLFLVRLLVVPLQMGCFMLCNNWFVCYRGRALGWVTIGSPLFSICGIALLTALVSSVGLKSAYLVIGCLVFLLTLLTLLFLRSDPEKVGLAPDGAPERPEETEEGGPIATGTLFRDKRTWLLVISYGLLQFIIVAVMSYFMIRLTSLGLTQAEILGWLSFGAAAGIAMSYLLGWVDDKIGSIRASWLLCGLYLFAILPMAIMPQGGNGVLMFLWAFGVACMTGGCPTLQPCITAYVYGRKQYQSANRWIMTLQSIIIAFAVYFMAAFSEAGNLTAAYWIMLVMLLIAFVALLLMRNVKDADAASRGYKENSERDLLD